MDWRRAKTILIIAFLLLDSFLAYQLWTSHEKNMELGEQVMGTGSSFQDVLKARNITLATEAPAETPEMNYLNVKYEDFSTDRVNSLPNQTPHIIGNVLQSRFLHPLAGPISMRKGEYTKTLADSILYADEYEPDITLSRPEKAYFLQYWNNSPFFGAVLELDLADNKVTGYRQSHFQVVNKGSGKKVISSLAAARLLIENGVIKNGETIYSIELGYYGHTYDAEIQVIVPVWRIVHGSGQVHYVNGITGVIEKNPSLPKKD